MVKQKEAMENLNLKSLESKKNLESDDNFSDDSLASSKCKAKSPKRYKIFNIMNKGKNGIFYVMNK